MSKVFSLIESIHFASCAKLIFCKPGLALLSFFEQQVPLVTENKYRDESDR